MSVAGGMLGGWLCDIDLNTKSDIGDYFAGIEMFATMGVMAVLDYFFGFGIIDYILTNRSMLNIVGLLVFVILGILGAKWPRLNPHRTFMHSLLALIVGLYCMFTPVDTYMVIGWAVGISMLADAIGRFAIWWAARKLHISDSWMLFSAIFSLVCGILVLASPALQTDIDLFIAYYIAAWLIAQGIVTIIRAWKVRELHVSLNTQMVGTHWYVPFIIGVLLVVLGVLSCMNPNIIAASIGLFIGLCIVISGANIITIATVLPTIEIVEVEE